MIGSKEYEDLIDKDPSLKPIIDALGDMHVEPKTDYFHSLISAILSQQLSGKVANVIVKRFFDHFGHRTNPDDIINEPDDVLRKLGISRQKITYIKSLSSCIKDESVHLSETNEMTDNEVIDMLVKVKGIGVWTAQMFLIFSLGRTDVFSCMDLGLRNAVKKLLANPDLTVKEMEEISKKWSPYRSVVSLYLWRWVD